MKKTFLLNLLFLVLICPARAAEKGAVLVSQPGVYIERGDSWEAVNGGTLNAYYVSDGESVRSMTGNFSLKLLSGGCVRCEEGSTIKIKRAINKPKEKLTELEIVKGRCMLNSGYESSVRMVVNAGDYVFEAGQSIFEIDVSKGASRLFSGSVMYYGRKKQIAPVEHAFEDSAASLSITAGIWEKWNYEQDRISARILITGAARDIIEKRLLSEYLLDDLNFKGTDPDMPIVAPADLDVSLTVTANDVSVLANGVIRDKKGNITGLIDITKKIKAGGDNQAAVAAVGLQAAEQIRLAAVKLAADRLKNGQEVFVELESSDPLEVKALQIVINGSPGIISSDSKDFYGKKTVFVLQCYNSGTGIAGYLAGKKAAGKNINVWNFTKNVVKLRLL